MPESIAVIDPFTLFDKESLTLTPLKREALMFDRLAMPNLAEGFLTDAIRKECPHIAADLEWLQENGIVFEPELESGHKLSEELKEAQELMVHHGKKMAGQLFGIDLDKLLSDSDEAQESLKEFEARIDSLSQRGRDEIKAIVETEEFRQSIIHMTAHNIRLYSIHMREAQNLSTCPILSVNIHSSTETTERRNNVLQIVLNALPVPADDTPWELILEFRNDADSRHKFLDLRNWMNEVARGELPPNEIEEKLEYLLSRYQRHMDLHKIKTNAGTSETVVVSSAEILQDIVTLKWKDAAKLLFPFRQRKIALLEGELTSPGSEVAYIVKAGQTFTEAAREV